MRIVIVSDTHNHLDKMTVPDGDLLIHCGDFSMRGDAAELKRFNEQLEVLPHQHKIVIAGNHDFVFERDEQYGRSLLTAATYLQDESLTLNGLKIYGSPWQPEFFSWAFNVPRNSQRMHEIWNRIPDDTDILVTHGPPHGILDTTSSGHQAGCEVLKQRLDKLKPRLHCFGHIHEAYGQRKIGDALFVNACNMSEDYKVSNPAVIVDV